MLELRLVASKLEGVRTKLLTFIILLVKSLRKVMHLFQTNKVTLQKTMILSAENVLSSPSLELSDRQLRTVKAVFDIYIYYFRHFPSK
jgi:hypothetical protein